MNKMHIIGDFDRYHFIKMIWMKPLLKGDQDGRYKCRNNNIFEYFNSFLLRIVEKWGNKWRGMWGKGGFFFLTCINMSDIRHVCTLLSLVQQKKLMIEVRKKMTAGVKSLRNIEEILPREQKEALSLDHTGVFTLSWGKGESSMWAPRQLRRWEESGHSHLIVSTFSVKSDHFWRFTIWRERSNSFL